VEPFDPIAGVEGSLEQYRAYAIIGDANLALNLAVLGRGVGTRHLELDAVREEESVGEVIELTTICHTRHSDWCSQTMCIGKRRSEKE
jgi:hypothetical protein